MSHRHGGSFVPIYEDGALSPNIALKDSGGHSLTSFPNETFDHYDKKNLVTNLAKGYGWAGVWQLYPFQRCTVVAQERTEDITGINDGATIDGYSGSGHGWAAPWETF